MHDGDDRQEARSVQLPEVTGEINPDVLDRVRLWLDCFQHEVTRTGLPWQEPTRLQAHAFSASWKGALLLWNHLEEPTHRKKLCIYIVQDAQGHFEARYGRQDAIFTLEDLVSFPLYGSYAGQFDIPRLLWYWWCYDLPRPVTRYSMSSKEKDALLSDLLSVVSTAIAQRL